jgi:hypothetical protein
VAEQFANPFTTGNAACTESSTLCREPDPKLSAQGRFAESKRSSSRHRKKPTVQTYCAEREQRHLSAQPLTHGTEELCRELQKRALGTAQTSRRKVTAATAVGPAVRCAESPPMALGTEICAECLTKALGKEFKKIKFTHSNLLLHQPTPLQKAYAQISHKNRYLFCI